MAASDKRYYFDACTLYKYYRDEPGSLEIRRLVAESKSPILVSRLTVLEVLSRLAKAYRGRNTPEKESRPLKKPQLNGIVGRLLKKDISTVSSSKSFEMIRMPSGVFKAAEVMLQTHAIDRQISIGSLDALHLAIMVKLDVLLIVVSFDKPLLRACEVMGMEIFEPVEK